MKTKKFAKKLVLNKETIADINFGKMDKVRGGMIKTTAVPDTIDPCDHTVCNCTYTYTACFQSRCPNQHC